MERNPGDDEQMQTALLAKVAQCRRLADQIDDPATAQRLRDLAAEYLQHIRNTSKAAD
jgi:hypothetical protein